MDVRDAPRNWTLTKGATRSSRVPPRKSMKRKSAVRPRNDVSSSIRQYRVKKNMWKTKSIPAAEKHPESRRVGRTSDSRVHRTASKQMTARFSTA